AHSHADDHLSRSRVTKRVADQVLKHPSYQVRIAAGDGARFAHLEGDGSLARQRGELLFERLEQRTPRKMHGANLICPGVERREVQQAIEKLLRCDQRALDSVGERPQIVWRAALKGRI